MDIKNQTQRQPEEMSEPVRRPLHFGINITNEIYGTGDAVIGARALQGFELTATRYPIHRLVRCAVRRKVEDVFDDLALGMGLAAMRLDTDELLLDGRGVFVQAHGAQKMDYASCKFKVWAESKTRMQETQAQLLQLVGERLVPEEMFTLDWQFADGAGALMSVSFAEVLQEPLFDEAYPVLPESIAQFTHRFLEAPDTVLILLGPPGSGKTRLVRSILAAMSRRIGDSAEVMYTADKRVLEKDEVFVKFITGSHHAFVIEDADRLLTARTSGNQDLHRFLAVADGVVRAQGRKIIFTTNLPNVTDIDEALLRPGRCFATIHTRSLTPHEAQRLIGRLIPDDLERQQTALATAFPPGVRSCSVAGIYRACA